MLSKLCDKMSQLPNPQVTPCLVTISSAPFDERSLVPICLLAPHLPFWHPICLSTPIRLFCIPFALCPFAFLASHLPYGTHLPFGTPMLFGTPFAFWHPHLPFGRHHSFRTLYQSLIYLHIPRMWIEAFTSQSATLCTSLHYAQQRILTAIVWSPDKRSWSPPSFCHHPHFLSAAKKDLLESAKGLQVTPIPSGEIV
jgi:hypothetical protein